MSLKIHQTKCTVYDTWYLSWGTNYDGLQKAERYGIAHRVHDNLWNEAGVQPPPTPPRILAALFAVRRPNNILVLGTLYLV